MWVLLILPSFAMGYTCACFVLMVCLHVYKMFLPLERTRRGGLREADVHVPAPLYWGAIIVVTALFSVWFFDGMVNGSHHGSSYDERDPYEGARGSYRRR